MYANTPGKLKRESIRAPLHLSSISGRAWPWPQRSAATCGPGPVRIRLYVSTKRQPLVTFWMACWTSAYLAESATLCGGRKRVPSEAVVAKEITLERICEPDGMMLEHSKPVTTENFIQRNPFKGSPDKDEDGEYLGKKFSTLSVKELLADISPGNENVTTTYKYNRTALILIPWEFELHFMSSNHGEESASRHIGIAMQDFKREKSIENHRKLQRLCQIWLDKVQVGTSSRGPMFSSLPSHRGQDVKLLALETIMEAALLLGHHNIFNEAARLLKAPLGTEVVKAIAAGVPALPWSLWQPGYVFAFLARIDLPILVSISFYYTRAITCSMRLRKPH